MSMSCRIKMSEREGESALVINRGPNQSARMTFKDEKMQF